ncbi:Ribosomal protein L22, bacterial/chloroplast-type [Cynara cardunculus var. scolymus]|uniref:Large ribosomal subunit protein uL22c n=1 Tax=Cynara cardunculus var. scolymus TaxID=59895 RepID=A0A103XEI2_CYNCS|nr:Ribosomal protein L22, bacterial/chloroplast-type [Cynara cardunculus var. scolymus]
MGTIKNRQSRFPLLEVRMLPAFGAKSWEGILVDKKEESTSTDMTLGTTIYNTEITLGKGGKLARAAGAVAKLIAKEGKSWPNISMSAHKVRRVIDQIRGRSYEETLIILELMPYRACYPIFKLVYSTATNASLNMGSNETNLVINKAEVNEGTTVKRLKPRARGRSYPIQNLLSI